MSECVIDENDPFYDRIKEIPMIADRFVANYPEKFDGLPLQPLQVIKLLLLFDYFALSLFVCVFVFISWNYSTHDWNLVKNNGMSMLCRDVCSYITLLVL